MSIILGVDPWTTTIGFAVIRKEERKVEILEYGIIATPPKLSLEAKLFELGTDFEAVLLKYKPTFCGIEKLFFFNNQKTGIDVAQARGTLIYLLAKNAIVIKELTPLQVKSGICWNGRATKKQVQNALKLILKLKEIPHPDDAADALAIAYISSFSV